MLVNLLVILLVVILSFVFKITDVKKYDNQLVFIILTFTVLILYKYINQYQNKCKRDDFTDVMNSNDMNIFINNKDNLEEELAKYKQLVTEYEKKYDIDVDVINENDIARLENNIDNLTRNVNRDIAREEPSNYIYINNSEPSAPNVEEEEETQGSVRGTTTASTDVVYQALLKLLNDNTNIAVTTN